MLCFDLFISDPDFFFIPYTHGTPCVNDLTLSSQNIYPHGQYYSIDLETVFFTIIMEVLLLKIITNYKYYDPISIGFT